MKAVMLVGPEILGEELSLIENTKMRRFVEACLKDAPEYFWRVPASSSGKYHPEWAQGEGGLVRHTKAAVRVAVDLLRAYPDLEKDRDFIVAALLLHDTLKHGTGEGRTVKEHPLLPEQYYRAHAKVIGRRAYKKVMALIRGHMGIWGPVKPRRGLFTRLTAAELVHLADYIASRKWCSLEKSDQGGNDGGGTHAIPVVSGRISQDERRSLQKADPRRSNDV